LQLPAVLSHKGRQMYVGRSRTAGLTGMTIYKPGNEVMLKDRMSLQLLPILNWWQCMYSNF